MKKLVSVLLIAAMVFAMVACGGDTDDGDQDVAGGSTKVGLGITVSLSATEATEDADGNVCVVSPEKNMPAGSEIC